MYRHVNNSKARNATKIAFRDWDATLRDMVRSLVDIGGVTPVLA